MNTNYFYDYAVIRVVPKVDREEFINVGIILSCEEKEFLRAKVEVDEERLKAFNSKLDIEIVKSHLEFIPAVCEGVDITGEIGKLSKRERFHWLTSPRSTIIQTSQVHSGTSKDPERALNHLFETMVKSESPNKD